MTVTLAAVAGGIPLRVVRTRLLIPATGVWIADLELDPDLAAVQTPSSGPATLTIDATPTGPLLAFKATVDPLGSGSFVSLSKVRLLGGGGGWGKTVPAQHFQSDAVVLSTDVYTQTGAIVGEVVTDVAPKAFGTDYVRSMGPASRVFGESTWWVDPVTGVTFVSPARPPAVADPSFTLVSWDPDRQRLAFTCDTVVFPGTVVVDTRIGATPVIVGDVEQTFDAQGSHGQAWAAPSSAGTLSRLQSALKNLVRELTRSQTHRPFRGRVVSMAPDGARVVVQAVDRAVTGLAAPMPDLIPASVWAGMQGDSATYLPSSELLVDFEDGDPAHPHIRGFAPGSLPLKRTLDASVELDVGPTAPIVKIAGGADSLVLATPFANILQALESFAGALSGASSFSAINSAAATLGTALSAIGPTAPTLKMKGT